MTPSGHQLSKTRFVAGVQCHKLLWWKVHEPLAEELQPDKVLQDRFDQGKHVGELARTRFPGGVLIEGSRQATQARLDATREALASDPSAIFEASFTASGVFVAADVLECDGGGYTLIEVKSASSQKEEHIPDVAIQLHVLENHGLEVPRVEIMHLNKEVRFPELDELFLRTDVAEAVEEYLPEVPGEIDRQIEVLGGPLPQVEIGEHCFSPRECPFRKRCWPQAADHIIKLYNVGPKKACKYMQDGVHRISDLPSDAKLPAAAQRQRKSMSQGRVIAESGLKDALAEFEGPLGFLDFETISRAVPVWDGMGPWHQATVQFSYHEERENGYEHVGWLAEGPDDPRPELAAQLIEATESAEKVVMYSPFERRCIRDLQRAVPSLEEPLCELEAKLIDLLPVIRNNLYHPEFHGSFSIKYVLNPLVLDLSYDDLVIVDGLVASVEIARLLFVAHKIPEEERGRIRGDLLAYCERDTWAMVRLLESLRELVASG